MIMDYDDGQMSFGDLMGLKFPDIRLTGEEKTSPRNIVPTGNRTRVRRVTDVHATPCSKAVDLRGGNIYHNMKKDHYTWVRKRGNV